MAIVDEVHIGYTRFHGLRTVFGEDAVWFGRTCLLLAVFERQRNYALRSRAIRVPSTSACSLASAIERSIGAMPQLVHGNSRSAGT